MLYQQQAPAWLMIFKHRTGGPPKFQKMYTNTQEIFGWTENSSLKDARMERIGYNFRDLFFGEWGDVKLPYKTEWDYSRFGKFCGIVTVESFAASAMGLTVGEMVSTTEAAMALGPSLMTVFIVFGGYYVNADNTPVIFRWIPRVSLIRWALKGFASMN
ncbi:hypothetical protein NE237_020453 [Protea cynaroides]|uniref:ABC-2 type transporter transmembrane domain-containing protein n=1 Tax=Protea cynaroides TaxID=273540 RepID=A0A9Q0K3W9_9MAGN|nr:hypothetical protein NE237_020453 [Protea cynaroides]